MRSMHTSHGFPSLQSVSGYSAWKYACAPSRGPLYTVRPPGASSKTVSSSSQISTRGWCTTVATGMRASCATVFSSRIRLSDVKASSPVVGSSRNIAAGAAASSTPTLQRLRCPPDTPRLSPSPMRTSRTWSMPSARIVSCPSRSRFRFGHSAGSRIPQLYAMFSATVSSGRSTSSCATKPTSSGRSWNVRSPHTRSTPPTSHSGGCLPSSVVKSTVLPAPDGPMIAVTCPARTFPDTPCSNDFPGDVLWFSGSVTRRFWKLTCTGAASPSASRTNAATPLAASSGVILLMSSASGDSASPRR
mmetsp:Transcript_17267/g.53606  ORF Transcript_17267/g.53606 Transcript_17267/m.53606 type:complete len:303 (-) Transcript_17267:524-1432(-)